MPERSNEDIIRIVTKYQNFGMVHELTCAVDNRHAALEPIERDGKVVLLCPTCQAVQEHIPEFVLTSEELLDHSLRKWAEAHEAAERRYARQDAWIGIGASFIGAGLLGGLWWDMPGAIVGLLFGGAVGWLATRKKRAALSRP